MDADQRHAQAKHEQRQTARGHAPTRWPEKRATVHRDRAEGKEMSVRGSNWTAEEDRRLLDFIEVGKSWVFIAAALKRTTRLIQDRARELKAKGK